MEIKWRAACRRQESNLDHGAIVDALVEIAHSGRYIG
jgi:hypothetical protein